MSQPASQPPESPMGTARLRLAAATSGVLLLNGCLAAQPAQEQPEPEQPWAWELPRCVGYQPGDYRTPEHRLSVSVRHRAATIEQVETYEPGWGPRAVDEIRAVLRECGSFEHGDPGDPTAFRQQQLVIDTGFAGDESLLVEIVHQQPPELHTRYAAVVRRGDEVTTLRTDVLDADKLRQLASDGWATSMAAQA